MKTKNIVLILLAIFTIYFVNACGSEGGGAEESPIPDIATKASPNTGNSPTKEEVATTSQSVSNSTESDAVVQDEDDGYTEGEWEDPVTGKHWLIGEVVDSADINCPVGYTVPTVLDAQDARDNGMLDTIDHFGYSPKMWVKNLSGANAGLVEAYKDIDTWVTTTATQGAVEYCLEQ